VDDILIASKNMLEIKRLKSQLGDEFEMKNLVVENKILGIEIHRDRKAGKLYFVVSFKVLASAIVCNIVCVQVQGQIHRKLRCEISI
jgi:hypothetical protein